MQNTEQLLQDQCDLLYGRLMEIKGEHDQLTSILAAWEEIGITPSIQKLEQEEKKPRRKKQTRKTIEDRIADLRNYIQENPDIPDSFEFDSLFAKDVWDLERTSASRILQQASDKTLIHLTRTEGEGTTAKKYYQFSTVLPEDKTEVEVPEEEKEEEEAKQAVEEVLWHGKPIGPRTLSEETEETKS